MCTLLRCSGKGECGGISAPQWINIQRGSTTQKALEDSTGVAQRNISSYESGKLQPSSRTLRKFAEAFGVPFEELAGESRKEPVLAIADPELLQMFREVAHLPEADRARLKWVISLALRNSRFHEMMAS